MQSIATLVQDDPYLKMPISERIALRRRRREIFRPAIEPKITLVADAPVPPEPIAKPKPLWFGVIEDITPQAARPQVKDIQLATCRHYDISRADMLSPVQTKDLVLPRHVAIFLCKKLSPERSLPDIGRRFGGRDHTTCLFAFRKIERLIKEDLELASNVADIEADIAELFA